MNEKMDWVEYGGHTIRRAVAEEVEESVQAHRGPVTLYRTMLEYVRSGRMGWMDIITIFGKTETIGEFVQELGLEVAAAPKDEDELRRKMVEDELEFGEALNTLHFRWGVERDIDRFEGKKPRPDETLGERFGLR